MRFFDEGCGPSDEPWEAATMGKSAEAKRLEGGARSRSAMGTLPE